MIFKNQWAQKVIFVHPHFTQTTLVSLQESQQKGMKQQIPVKKKRMRHQTHVMQPIPFWKYELVIEPQTGQNEPEFDAVWLFMMIGAGGCGVMLTITLWPLFVDGGGGGVVYNLLSE